MSNKITDLQSSKISKDYSYSDYKEVSLHQGATNYLFEHFYVLRRIFSNILGLIETDYLSIAFINKQDKIFFLSSTPSIDQNMINKNLWRYDGSYDINFINQKSPKLWSDLYSSEYAELIHKYKQEDQSLISGISIPFCFYEYRIVLSFGSKTELFEYNKKFLKHVNDLTAIGAFCLREIRQNIPMLDKVKKPRKKTKLKLIFNNGTINENFTR